MPSRRASGMTRVMPLGLFLLLGENVFTVSRNLQVGREDAAWTPRAPIPYGAKCAAWRNQIIRM